MYMEAMWKGHGTSIHGARRFDEIQHSNVATFNHLFWNWCWNNVTRWLYTYMQLAILIRLSVNVFFSACSSKMMHHMHEMWDHKELATAVWYPDRYMHAPYYVMLGSHSCSYVYCDSDQADSYPIQASV